MKLQRFFVERAVVPGENISITDEGLANQIRRVFRMTPGDRVGLLDDSGKGYEATITDFGKDSVDFDVSDTEISVFIPEKEVWLYVSIPKKDKFEWVVEKATEIGVSHIVPVISDRTEKQNIKWGRVERIVKEASEQSERGIKPVIHDVMNLEDIENYGAICALHMSGDSLVKHPVFNQEKVSALVGPEGGWSEKDLKIFEEKGIPLLSLGQQVLRAETASVAIASVLLLN